MLTNFLLMFMNYNQNLFHQRASGVLHNDLAGPIDSIPLVTLNPYLTLVWKTFGRDRSGLSDEFIQHVDRLIEEADA